MSDRLFLERECEHGYGGACENPAGVASENCPGGSRREVVVDYERAARSMPASYRAIPLGHVKVIVDAALRDTETGGEWSDFRTEGPFRLPRSDEAGDQ